MGQFVCHAKQYIFYRISFGLFCCNINFGICIFIGIAIIKDSIIFMTVYLINKMSFVIKPYFYPNGKIIMALINFMNCIISFLVSSFNSFGNTHLIPVSLAESIYSFLNCFSIQNIKNTHLGIE